MGLPTRTLQDEDTAALAAELVRRAEYDGPDDEEVRRRDEVARAAVELVDWWARMASNTAAPAPRALRDAVEALREYAPAEIAAPADVEEALRSPWAVAAAANAREEVHTLAPLPWSVNEGVVLDAKGDHVTSVTHPGLSIANDEHLAALIVWVVNGTLPVADNPWAVPIEGKHARLRHLLRGALGPWHADRGTVPDAALIEYVEDAVRAAGQAGELRAELAARLDELHVVRAELAETASERAAAHLGREHAERVTAGLRERLSRVRNAMSAA